MLAVQTVLQVAWSFLKLYYEIYNYYLYVCVYVYVCVWRERERKRERTMGQRHFGFDGDASTSYNNKCRLKRRQK